MFDRKKWRKEYNERNRKRINDYAHQYYWTHIEQVRKNQKVAEANIKLDVLIHYGGNPPKCACCDESNIKFLTIDHINGCGQQLRKKHGLGSGFYRWLRRENYPDGFQVLCYNCNMARSKNNGVCPHKESE